MKNFDPVTFDYTECRLQLEDLKNLLASKAALSEKNDILPLFQSKRQLATLFGMFNSRIGWADRFAKEFNIFGDFSCDLAVGDWDRGAFCFIEFEDAREGSVFEKKGDKATREWGKRFEHGYSQIIDWLHKLATREVSIDNLARFGRHEITYEAVLVIGKNCYQDLAETQRLQWRSDKVSVNQKKVLCMTFDDLMSQFETRMSLMAVVEKNAAEKALAGQKAVAPAPTPPAPTTPPPGGS
jgi:hypothetical protein